MSYSLGSGQPGIAYVFSANQGIVKSAAAIAQGHEALAVAATMWCGGQSVTVGQFCWHWAFVGIVY